jgi:hypothetical protein|tara:strand:+ start:148 stop:285 length:138 start_codon:yes stop_codon:yes gene_type:complete
MEASLCSIFNKSLRAKRVHEKRVGREEEDEEGIGIGIGKGKGKEG